jgi:putative ABC transport system permease protein
MVRARLRAVTGQAVGPATAPEPAETTRSGEDGEDGDKEESQRDGFTRRRMFNLSARPGLSDSEVLVEGRPFTPGGFADDGKELPEISLEMRFAERMELALGDVLEFDIQGVSISGKVVNLRRVRWATFQPNFFVQFQPGVLDDAPKTWVAAAPGLPPERRAVLQTEIVKRFPNVSIVDVTSTVTRILGVIDQMSRAITAMAYLSLAAGLAVLYAIANHQAARRRRETALLKALGARFSDITRTSLWEFGTLGLAAGVLGGVISLGVSYGVSRFIFEAPWAFDHRSLLAGIVGVGGLAVATGWVAVRASLRTKPAELLNGAANL